MKSNPDNSEYSLILSPEAQDDIVDILNFTLSEWGETQMKKYSEILDHALQLLQSNPQIGHKRPDIPITHRAYLAGQHVIIYWINEKNIMVSRILHGSMNFPSRFM